MNEGKKKLCMCHDTQMKQKHIQCNKSQNYFKAATILRNIIRHFFYIVFFAHPGHAGGGVAFASLSRSWFALLFTLGLTVRVELLHMQRPNSGHFQAEVAWVQCSQWKGELAAPEKQVSVVNRWCGRWGNAEGERVMSSLEAAASTRCACPPFAQQHFGILISGVSWLLYVFVR